MSKKMFFILCILLVFSGSQLFAWGGGGGSTADTTPPTVSLTAPANGATITAGTTVTVSANATDNVAVDRVIFYVNGSSIGIDYSAPYSRSWNTTGYSGSVSIYARAVDTSGNAANSATRTVTVQQAPSGPVASTRGGMGSILYSGGTTFRVWAPHASSVRVAGDFNSWSTTANPLASEGNGHWSVDVSGAAAGHGYKFVIIYNGNTLWRNDPHARQVTNSVGHSIIIDRNYNWSSFNMPNWGELTIYQLHVKSWTDNISGNGTPFAKVASKAGYLRDSLAVNAVKMLPVAEFPGDYSWGYNPAHLFAIEESYGGYLAFKNMVNTLHQNGIAVIMDVVHNHWGPSDLELWRFDGPSLGHGGIYFFTDWRASTPWGDTRPDYGRGEVRQFIRDNSIYWLEEMNCDGLRWDATVYMHKTSYDGADIPEGWTLLQWCNNEKNARFPWKISIAEDLQDNPWVTRATGAGGLGFDSQWDSFFVHRMRDQLSIPNDGSRNMWTVRDAIAGFDHGNPTTRLKYTESHDECAGPNGNQRLLNDIDSSNPRSYWARKRGAIGILTTIFSPGIPMIFQGQENLETGTWTDTKRFSWADVSNFSGYVAMVRDANRLKRNWYNNTRGLRGNNVNVFHVNNTAKVIAFRRWQSGGPGDDTIVVINFSNTQYNSYTLHNIPRNGTWYCRFNSDWNGYDPSFGNFGGYNTSANSGSMNIGLGAYAVQVYSQ